MGVIIQILLRNYLPWEIAFVDITRNNQLNQFQSVLQYFDSTTIFIKTWSQQSNEMYIYSFLSLIIQGHHNE